MPERIKRVLFLLFKKSISGRDFGRLNLFEKSNGAPERNLLTSRGKRGSFSKTWVKAQAKEGSELRRWLLRNSPLIRYYYY